MDLSNIPILKNIDFSDPAKKKSFFLVLASGAMVILLLVLLLVRNAKETTEGDGSANTEAEQYQSPDIPMGEDRDRLEGKSLRDVFSGKQNKTDDLFDDTDQGDPLADLFEEETKEDSVESQKPLGAKDVYPEGRKRENEQDTQQGTSRFSKMKPAPVDPYKDYPSRQAREEQEQAEREAEIRRQMLARGYDPDTGMPLNGNPYVQQPSQPVQQEPAPQEEPEPATPKAQVRKSGGVSSLGKGLGSSVSSGITSLGEDSQYVTEDPAHPFKVKFAYDEKIESGQRVTLRLCEDMVVEGVLVPANTHLFAICSVGNRLTLKVTSLNINGNIYSINLVAFDNDGGEGLYCPQNSQAGKQAAQEAGQIASTTVQSAMGGLAGRIVSAGATLIRSKNGSEKVEVTAGYQFYLMQPTN